MKVVLTGGPCGGKTALAQIIQKEFGSRAVSVPESASILFSGGFPRGLSDIEMVPQQRAIYLVQCELESIIEIQFPKRLLICDRGTVDGYAYWPKSSALDLFAAVGTTKEKEFKRYDLVIHLKVTTSGSYDTTNRLRIEAYPEALRLDKEIEKAWEGHPNRVIIENARHFSKKVQQVLDILNPFVNART